MNARDRSLVFAVVLIIVAVGGYFLVVQPEHHKADQLQIQIASAQTQLSQAEAEVQTGLNSESEYRVYVKQLRAIEKAVPADAQIPELINELQAAATKSHLSFAAVSASSTSAAAPSTSSPTGTTSAASFPSQSFTLSFTGTYLGVAELLGRLAGYVHTDDNKFKATGRLLSITSVSITRGGTTGTKAPGNAVTAAVTAIDYDVPGALLGSSSLTTGTAAP